MQKRLLSGLIISTAALFALALAPVSVQAHEGEDSTTTIPTTTSSESSEHETMTAKERLEAQKERVEAHKQTAKDNRQEKLDAAKQRICEVRKKQIQNIMTRTTRRAENHIEVFTSISGRVQAFYVRKGKTLANYDQLVAAVNAAKTDAETEVAALKSLDTFSCTSDNPKGDAEAFKSAVKSVNEKLKAYRTAVKNLIVGVKSVQGTTSSQKEGEQQ